MRAFLLLMILLGITACKDEGLIEEQSDTSTCKGEWTEANDQGLVTARFEEYFLSNMGCVTENRPLTAWEKSLLKVHRRGTVCEPVTSLSSVSLRSANNYYKPRNGSIYLDLNAETGVFRRLFLSQSKDGTLLFEREQGCWFEREDLENEIINPQDYGKQILLDLELAASTKLLHPMEVFRYTESGGNWEMTRFDQNDDISYQFCPYLSTPWEYCTELRNGNIMFHPILDAATMDKLRSEAELIRSEFNYIEVPNLDFEDLWTSVEDDRIEMGSWDAIRDGLKFEFGVSGVPDVPLYVHRSWRDYLLGNRPEMPDVTSPKIRPVCYSAEREIVLENGDLAEIYGEVCYVDGEYFFIED